MKYYFVQYILDNNLHSHVVSSVKRQEPTIRKLVTTYNKLCCELQGMIRLQRAPPGAIPPLPIPSKGIFELDVDSDIWHDVGLEGCSIEPPRWLADEGVRKGIRLMLEIDRCNEEEKRLSRECTILQKWFSIEWKSVNAALGGAGEYGHYFHSIILQYLDKCYEHQLNTYRHSLMEVYVMWEAKIRHIPCAWFVPSWGPTAEDMADHLTSSEKELPICATGHPINQQLESYDSEWEEEDPESDDELLRVIEGMELEEEYQSVEDDEEFSTDDEWLENVENNYLPSSPVQLSTKRRRY